MEQPEGFVVPGQEKKVCRLIKSLYGLKQVPKQWHEKFDKMMLSNGFMINECDKCVYIKVTQMGYVMVCLYVDDMLIIGSNNECIVSTKRLMSKNFDMKDLGVADVVLGIKIIQISEGIILTQSHYVESILKRFKAWDELSAKTLTESNLLLITYFTTGIFASYRQSHVFNKLHSSRHRSVGQQAEQVYK